MPGLVDSSDEEDEGSWQKTKQELGHPSDDEDEGQYQEGMPDLIDSDSEV
jgi:hypothetical protein